MRPILAGLIVLQASAAGAADIGFSGPLSGPFAIIGQQMNAGVAAAAGPGVIAFDDACTAEGGKAAAEAMIAAQVRFVVGFACTEAIDAALPLLAPAGIPVITPAVRATHLADLRHKTGHLFYRLAPRADAEAVASARLLKARWGDAPWAVIDDGAPINRSLAEAFRYAMEDKGLKAAFADAFRPAQENQVGLVKRIVASGARHVFIAGERSDIAVIARSAAQGAANANPQLLEFAGGESLRAAPDDVALPDGVLMVAPPDWSGVAAPAELNAIRATGVEPDGYAAASFAATEIARSVLSGSDYPATALASTVFSTAIGPVSFDAKGDWTEDRWMLFSSFGQTFAPVSEP